MHSTRVSSHISRTRQISVFLFVLIVGFIMFAAPAVFFQMGYGGGYAGANLAILGVLQLVLVGCVVIAGLRMLAMRRSDIGVTWANWQRDALLGVVAAVVWGIVQFGWLIPGTGGADRADVASILQMVDGSWHNVAWYLPLGILGGGVAEELYVRGFMITVLESILGGSVLAAGMAGLFSTVFFALGHLPEGWVDWLDILVPSAAYVGLFLYTRRLIAPVVAHATWNTLAVIGILLIYG
jgi:hypothetical protein